jgi:hypothetical protein
MRTMSRTTLQQVAVTCLGSLLLATQSQAAPASWTLVRSEPSIAYYLNKSTVRMRGTYLTYWILVNFSYDPKFDGAEPYKSALLLRYANCATREQDTKSLLQYHAPMGRGEPIWAQSFDDATMRMESVESGSVSAQLLDIACSLKE